MFIFIHLKSTWSLALRVESTLRFIEPKAEQVVMFAS